MGIPAPHIRLVVAVLSMLSNLTTPLCNVITIVNLVLARRLMLNKQKPFRLLPLVNQNFTLGSDLAVKIKREDGTRGYSATLQTVPIVQSLRQVGVFARPLGSVIYIMAPSREKCTRLTDILYK
jgi:adenosylmethionine-8-amino-7-oxononanoate aminotransferase